MSVVTMSSQRARSSRRPAAQAAIPDEKSEFQGFWLNVGIRMPNGNFARLNRGIAIDDLFTRKVYESTDPLYAKEIALTNKAVAILKKLSNQKKMAEGESIPLPNLEVVLYRKQEGSEMDDDAAGLAEMEAFLLGGTDGDDEQDPAAKAAAEESEAAIEAEIERRMAERLAAADKKPAGRVTRTTTQVEDDEDDDILRRKA